MAELWTPGTRLPSRTRVMTAERMRWYADALETCTHDTDRPLVAAPNIHTDDEIARANGLPARVPDGMVSTNWISSMLGDTFGEDYLARGSLRTRYVRPIYEDDHIEVVVRITGRESTEDGRHRLTADVACVKADGEVATGGTATILLADG
jgi:3-hydroxybutyryl-CoA dehydratase